MVFQYKNRSDAGRVLAARLKQEKGLTDVVVVALPRGGVPVAYEVAQALAAPLEVITVRKIGAPAHPELAAGAVTASGSIVWNDTVLAALGLIQNGLLAQKEKTLQEARKLDKALRPHGSNPRELFAKTVIVIDDGLATGATMKAALKAVIMQKPDRVIVAVPVGPEDTCKEIEKMGYSVVCAHRVPEGGLSSVGEWYRDFSQVDTEECRTLLAVSSPKTHTTPPGELGLH